MSSTASNLAGQRVGIVGVGNIGGAIAHRLLDLGAEVWVRDIRREAEAPLAARGARVAASPAALVRQVDATLVVVVDAAQIGDVLFNEDAAAAPELRAGSTVLLLSTIAPADTRRFAATLGERGVDVLDAPISGGPTRAREGTMSLMLAGEPAACDAVAPLLAAISGRVFRVGAEPGRAAAMKLVNNLLAGVNLAAAAEALVLGRRAGLELATMLDVIGASSGGSWILTDRGQRLLAGDEAPRAHLAILAKDLGLALAMAGEPLAFGTAASERFAEALASGLAAADDSALISHALSGRR